MNVPGFDQLCVNLKSEHDWRYVEAKGYYLCGLCGTAWIRGKVVRMAH